MGRVATLLKKLNAKSVYGGYLNVQDHCGTAQQQMHTASKHATKRPNNYQGLHSAGQETMTLQRNKMLRSDAHKYLIDYSRSIDLHINSKD